MVNRMNWLGLLVFIGLLCPLAIMAEPQEVKAVSDSVKKAVTPLEIAREKAEAHASTMEPNRFDWDPLDIIGSKHDLSALNHRAGVQAMEGVSYDNYGYACVYCHIPPDVSSEKGDAPQQISGWNRLRSNMQDYTLYSSQTFQSEARIPNEVTLLCLSCHDGTMAVDRVVNTPRAWKSGKKMTMHMKINSGTDLDHCGLCHDGFTAHHLGNRHVGTDMRRNHPVSIRYPGVGAGYTGMAQSGFKSPDNGLGFANGVRLYNGFVECASCHNVHEPSKIKFLRVTTEFLCVTCHFN